MQYERNDSLQGCWNKELFGPLTPALWLAAGLGLGAIPANAQIMLNRNQSGIQAELQCATFNLIEYTNQSITVNPTNYDFTTNQDWSLSAETANAQQDTHVTGLHFYGSGSVTLGASGGNSDYPNFATAQTMFSISGSSTCFTLRHN